MFWKRTTGTDAVAGLIAGFGLSVLFNNYAPGWFGHDTWLYTAYYNSGSGHYEIPFLICMGLAFGFTLLLMTGISLFGPQLHAKALKPDAGLFAVNGRTLALIVVTLILFTLLYVKFW